MPTKDPVKLRENRRRYYLRHREQIIEKMLARYRKNPRRWQKRVLKWREANKEKVNAYDRQYRQDKKIRTLTGLKEKTGSPKAAEVAKRLLAKAEDAARLAKYGIEKRGNANP